MWFHFLPGSADAPGAKTTAGRAVEENTQANLLHLPDEATGAIDTIAKQKQGIFGDLVKCLTVTRPG